MTDKLLNDLTDYIVGYRVDSDEAIDTARLCLMDSLGCAVLALNYPACTKLLGPVVDAADMPPKKVSGTKSTTSGGGGGAKVPGTFFQLDPVQAAFNLGAMIRWLDYNDTWLAAEWGHPSDNFGAILAVADYLDRQPGHAPVTVADVLTAAIKAYEIQGVIALENAFNRVGLDHVILVRIASAGVAAFMLGGTRQHVFNALSHAFIDGGALRTYRHAPNTGSRKSWAAGDAASRAVRLALIALRGEMGYPQALSAPKWGFHDVVLGGRPVTLGRALGSYVMENILFKISFPAEFHAQTAVEAAIILHPQVKDRLSRIERIVIETQESAVRIIDKAGPLHNPADRDHCIQYMTAIGLIFGDLTADHYEDAAAADPRIDALRAKMRVAEDPRYTRDYLDPDKRSIGNAVQVFFGDGSSTDRVAIEYPLGHRRRRAEAIPLLEAKFAENLATRFGDGQCQKIIDAFTDADRLHKMRVNELIDLFLT